MGGICRRKELRFLLKPNLFVLFLGLIMAQIAFAASQTPAAWAGTLVEPNGKLVGIQMRQLWNFAWSFFDFFNLVNFVLPSYVVVGLGFGEITTTAAPPDKSSSQRN